MDPGYLIQLKHPDGTPEMEIEQDPLKAKEIVVKRIEEGYTVRVFACIEVMQVVGGKVARAPDGLRKTLEAAVVAQVKSPLKP